jgi:hypothetical protein
LQRFFEMIWREAGDISDSAHNDGRGDDGRQARREEGGKSYDPLRGFEEAIPHRFCTGMRRGTSPEFLAELRARQKQRRQSPAPVEEVASDDEPGEGGELKLQDAQIDELIEEVPAVGALCTTTRLKRMSDSPTHSAAL